MPYDPQTNAANRAIMGQGPASVPFTSNAIRNPAMTSPVAGMPAGGPPPVPGVGAPQGPVTSGEPPPGAFAQAGPLTSAASQAVTQARAGQGAFGVGATSAPAGNSRSSLGSGAFGGGSTGARGR